MEIKENTSKYLLFYLKILDYWYFFVSKKDKNKRGNFNNPIGAIHTARVTGNIVLVKKFK